MEGTPLLLEERAADPGSLAATPPRGHAATPPQAKATRETREGPVAVEAATVERIACDAEVLDTIRRTPGTAPQSLSDGSLRAMLQVSEVSLSEDRLPGAASG